MAFASSLAGVALLALAGAHVAVMLLGSGLAAGALLTVLGPLRVVLRYFERLATHAATFRALADLRVWFFQRFASRSAGGLGMQRSGDLAARLVADVETLDGLYLRILVPLGVAVMLFVLLTVVLAGEGAELWAAGLAAAGLFAAAAFVIPAWAALAARRSGADMARAGAALRVTVLDALTRLREVKSFAAEGRVLDQLGRGDLALGAAQERLARRAAYAQAGGFLCAQLAILLILLYAGTRPVFAAGAVFLLVGAFEAAGRAAPRRRAGGGGLCGGQPGAGRCTDWRGRPRARSARPSANRHGLAAGGSAVPLVSGAPRPVRRPQLGGAAGRAGRNPWAIRLRQVHPGFAAAQGDCPAIRPHPARRRRYRDAYGHRSAQPVRMAVAVEPFIR